jgi:DNA replication initiation complex subunit (GINS family)
MDLSELQDIDSKEKEGSALHNVPGDFYPRLKTLIKAKRGAMDPNRIITIREYENILMLANRIISRRISKISFFASRDMEAHNMTSEELGLYATVSASAKELRESAYVEPVANAEAPKAEEPKPAPQEEGKKEERPKRRIRIIKFVDAYRGLDNREYGPFNIGVILSEMPNDEAEWLLGEGYAEEV